jgi:hypothetical protein
LVRARFWSAMAAAALLWTLLLIGLLAPDVPDQARR